MRLFTPIREPIMFRSPDTGGGRWVSAVTTEPAGLESYTTPHRSPGPNCWLAHSARPNPEEELMSWLCEREVMLCLHSSSVQMKAKVGRKHNHNVIWWGRRFQWLINDWLMMASLGLTPRRLHVVSIVHQSHTSLCFVCSGCVFYD